MEGVIQRRAQVLFEEQRQGVHRRTDRMFAGLLLAQWAASIVLAITVSPHTWEGKTQAVHAHVYAAIFLGGAITLFPVILVMLRPGWIVTRHVVACAQMLWSGLLIHLTGGRIETHFHVFGSLAFLGFYRDWQVYIPATLVVASDHVLRQFLWPESVFGVLAPEWWRFLEHAWWVVFEDVFMVGACVVAVREMRALAQRQAEAEAATRGEQEKALALDGALQDLQRSQVALVRNEKLAAVGKLAASVGHELRNPLSAVRNAHTYISKRLTQEGKGDPTQDPRLKQFFEVMDKELNNCSRIISDLLDFARERPPTLRPTPLAPLVDDALEVIARPPRVQVRNEVPSDLPVPLLDKDQFRQVLINLIQNAVEAVPEEAEGLVRVTAEGGGDRPWQIRVADNGAGIPEAQLRDIFQPLFTTKTKGTGLGLAIVAGMVERHGGTIRVESAPGTGTSFIIDLPPAAAAQAA